MAIPMPSGVDNAGLAPHGYNHTIDDTFTPTDHDGYPSDEVVMSVASSFRDGAYTVAPGY